MTAQTNIPTDSASGESDGGAAEVIDLWKWRADHDAQNDRRTGIPQTGSVSGVRYEAPEARPKVRRARPTTLDVALIQIATARDASADMLERSNAFDAWRDGLRLLAKSAVGAAPEFRELLGLLLAAVHKQDASDLSSQVLAALQDATARLKSRPTSIDLGRVSASLRAAGAKTMLPLATDDASHDVVQELESIIEAAERTRS